MRISRGDRRSPRFGRAASADRLPDDPFDRIPGACFRPDPQDRRSQGLVLRQLVVAPAGLARHSVRRRRLPAWPPRSRFASRRRRRGLLARRGDRAKPPPTPGRRDEASRARMARVRSHWKFLRLTDPADGDFRSARSAGPRLLVCRFSPAQVRLRRNASGDRGYGFIRSSFNTESCALSPESAPSGSCSRP